MKPHLIQYGGAWFCQLPTNPILGVSGETPQAAWHQFDATLHSLGFSIEQELAHPYTGDLPFRLRAARVLWGLDTRLAWAFAEPYLPLPPGMA